MSSPEFNIQYAKDNPFNGMPAADNYELAAQAAVSVLEDHTLVDSSAVGAVFVAPTVLNELAAVIRMCLRNERPIEVYQASSPGHPVSVTWQPYVAPDYKLVANDLAIVLQTLLDAMDYSKDACAVTEMIGACVPQELLLKCHEAIALAKAAKVGPFA